MPVRGVTAMRRPTAIARTFWSQARKVRSAGRGMCRGGGGACETVAGSGLEGRGELEERGVREWRSTYLQENLCAVVQAPQGGWADGVHGATPNTSMPGC